MSTPFPPWTVSDQTIQVRLGLLGLTALDTALGRTRGDMRGFPQTAISFIIQTVRGDQITTDPTPIRNSFTRNRFLERQFQV